MDLQKVKVDLKPQWLGFNNMMCGKVSWLVSDSNEMWYTQNNVCCKENVQLYNCTTVQL